MKKIFLVMAVALLSAACMRLPQVPTLVRPQVLPLERMPAPEKVPAFPRT